MPALQPSAPPKQRLRSGERCSQLHVCPSGPMPPAAACGCCLLLLRPAAHLPKLCQGSAKQFLPLCLQRCPPAGISPPPPALSTRQPAATPPLIPSWLWPLPPLALPEPSPPASRKALAHLLMRAAAATNVPCYPVPLLWPAEVLHPAAASAYAQTPRLPSPAAAPTMTTQQLSGAPPRARWQLVSVPAQ